jgi:hypothetical protein
MAIGLFKVFKGWVLDLFFGEPQLWYFTGILHSL